MRIDPIQDIVFLPDSDENYPVNKPQGRKQHSLLDGSVLKDKEAVGKIQCLALRQTSTFWYLCQTTSVQVSQRAHPRRPL
jgi:hypothetical protein